MDDYIPITILNPIYPEIIEHEQMMERVFRKRSIESGKDITELAFLKLYDNKTYKP